METLPYLVLEIAIASGILISTYLQRRRAIRKENDPYEILKKTILEDAYWWK